jgi:hypothetical protein
MSDLIKLQEYNGNYEQYFENIFKPYFQNLKNKNIKLNDKELKKLEVILCTGTKYHSLVYSSLYYDYYRNSDVKTNLLNVVTENNCFSEKLFLRVIGLIETFVNKYQYYHYVLNFDWIYFLKKNGFNLTDEHMKLLKKIGFNETLIQDNNLNDEIYDFYINLGKILVLDKPSKNQSGDIKNAKNKLDKLIEYLEKNSDKINKYVLNKIYKEICSYIQNLSNYHYDDKYHAKLIDITKDFINELYNKLLKNKYKITDDDLEEFIINYINLIEEFGDIDDEHSLNNFLKFFNERVDFFLEYIKFINPKSIELFFENHEYSVSKINYQNKMIDKLLDNVNTKVNILKYILISTYSIDDEYSNTGNVMKERYNLIKKILEKKIDNFDRDLVIYAIEMYDEQLLNFMLENNLIEIDNELFNLACFKSLEKFIKNIFQQKYIPNKDNLKNCINIDIAKVLINEGGLLVDIETIKYFIENNSDYINLDEYDFNTSDKLKIIEDLCY